MSGIQTTDILMDKKGKELLWEGKSFPFIAFLDEIQDQHTQRVVSKHFVFNDLEL